MTCNYLKDCLKWIYNKFASENRKIVLFMDGPNIKVIGERDKNKKQLIDQPYSHIHIVSAYV